MKKKQVVAGGIFCLVMTGIVAVTVATGAHSPSPIEVPRSNLHVALIGASITEGWHIAEWPTRVSAPGYSAEALTVWKFDKTEAVDELLRRPSRTFRFTRTYLRSLFGPPPPRPDIVILKECSSYFPGDLRVDELAVKNWVGRLRGAGAEVVLATVVPVTRARAARDEGKQESLTAYNGWVRRYARDNGLHVLDLDAALRAGPEGSNLRDDLTSGDGTHLDAAAYAILDRALLATLCGLHRAAGCNVGQGRTLR